MHAQQLALQFDGPSLPAAMSAPSLPPPSLRVVASVQPTVPVIDQESSRSELERFLRASLRMPVHLTITDNRRNLFSWRRQVDHVTLRLHHMFLTAGPDARGALASYMGGARSRLREIRKFIRDNMHQVRGVEPVLPERTRGAHHDLRALYDSLNLRYFDGRCDTTITWGRMPPRRRRRRSSMRLGSYTIGDGAIRIHPLLDHPSVPPFFVAAVVHHEMLHHMVPAREVGGRLQYHCPEFRKREREFEHFDLAAQWEKQHIDELLRR